MPGGGLRIILGRGDGMTGPLPSTKVMHFVITLIILLVFSNFIFLLFFTLFFPFLCNVCIFFCHVSFFHTRVICKYFLFYLLKRRSPIFKLAMEHLIAQVLVFAFFLTVCVFTSSPA